MIWINMKTYTAHCECEECGKRAKWKPMPRISKDETQHDLIKEAANQGFVPQFDRETNTVHASLCVDCFTRKNPQLMEQIYGRNSQKNSGLPPVREEVQDSSDEQG